MPLTLLLNLLGEWSGAEAGVFQVRGHEQCGRDRV